MSLKEDRRWLEKWDARTLLLRQWGTGRSSLTRSEIASYAQDHERASMLLAEAALSPQDRRLARMLEAITAPLAALHINSIPTYYSYTGLNLLDEYVDSDRLNLDEQKVVCVEGIRALILALAQFECATIIGSESRSRYSLDLEICVQRLHLIRRQYAALSALEGAVGVPSVAPGMTTGAVPHRTLEQYLLEDPPLSAMIDFTCVPSSSSHDEVLFLRTIAEDELCFKGIYVCTRQAGEAIERGLGDAAITLLSQAIEFVVMLHESFRVMQSMPPAHFMDFREITGQASAVQSFNYQRMEIALFGSDPEKVEIFRRIPHLHSMLQFCNRTFASLKTLLHFVTNAESYRDELIRCGRLLDRHLLSWRGLHLSFALRYLPSNVSGTGGTAGAAYLQRFFRQSIFSESEPDYALIDEISGDGSRIEDIFRARSGTRISPLKSYWLPPSTPPNPAD